MKISAESGAMGSKARVALTPLLMGDDVFKFVFRITLDFSEKARQSSKLSEIATKTKVNIVKDMKLLGAKDISIGTKHFNESQVIFTANATFKL